TTSTSSPLPPSSFSSPPPPPTHFSPLSLHDALPICLGIAARDAYPSLLQQRLDASRLEFEVVNAGVSGDTSAGGLARLEWALQRSEEHTSELQSRFDLVCRLLLEKKKKKKNSLCNKQ